MTVQTQAAGIAGSGWGPESGFGTLGLQSCISSGLSDLKAIQTQADCTSLTEATKLRMRLTCLSMMGPLP